MQETDVEAAVAAASAAHPLKRGGPAYQAGFVSAFTAVCAERSRAQILQQKFGLPDESSLTGQMFYESASELSVANHIVHQRVSDFAVEKRVNTTNKKNVDVWHCVRGTQVATEVKCPVEPKTQLPTVAGAGAMIMEIKTAGRLPDHAEQLLNFKQQVESGGAGPVVIGKNKDLALKDALVSAHSKFAPTSSAGDLNVMFLAAGNVGHLNDSYMHLFANGGLFTARAMHPAAEFSLVDVVVVSNLRYWHEQCATLHDWSLRNVLLVPFVNPHHRKSLLRESLIDGLSVFDHHKRRFEQFDDVGAASFPDYVRGPLKLLHYINDDLSAEELKRYFPVQLQPLGKAAHGAARRRK